MTEQAQEAIRQMVSGTDAENLKRVSQLSEIKVFEELGKWSAFKVYQLQCEKSSLYDCINKIEKQIELLTPFIDKAVNPNPK